MERSDLVVVTGAGGFIGGHLVAELRRRGHRRIRAVDIKPLDEWYQMFDDVENRVARSARARRLSTSRRSGRALRLQPRRRHGRHGLHRAEQSRVHADGAHQHAHADGRAQTAGVERFFYSSSACVYAAEKQTSAAVSAAARGRCLPGDAGGRVRLGEAVQRADVPPFHRGFRTRDARRPLSQRLRSVRHLRRRPREGAGRHLPQGHRRPSSPDPAKSRSGATASRRGASPTSTTASRARCA